MLRARRRFLVVLSGPTPAGDSVGTSRIGVLTSRASCIVQLSGDGGNPGQQSNPTRKTRNEDSVPQHGSGTFPLSQTNSGNGGPRGGCAEHGKGSAGEGGRTGAVRRRVDLSPAAGRNRTQNHPAASRKPSGDEGGIHCPPVR